MKKYYRVSVTFSTPKITNKNDISGYELLAGKSFEVASRKFADGDGAYEEATVWAKGVAENDYKDFIATRAAGFYILTIETSYGETGADGKPEGYDGLRHTLKYERAYYADGKFGEWETLFEGDKPACEVPGI